MRNGSRTGRQILRQLRRVAELIDPKISGGGLTTRIRSGAAIVGGSWLGVAHGKAGGGSHSGGSSSARHGGGYSSGSSHGGGGDGSLDGVVALIIIAVIVWYVMRRLRRRAQVGGQSVQPPVAATNAAGRPSLPPAIDDIRTQDPGFELETFLQRAEMTFFLVKRGMQNNDAAAVRPYLNDPVYGEVSTYIGQMKGQHRRALYESLNVRAVHLDSARCDAGGQAIEVHFDLVYRLKTFDDAGGVLADEGTDGRHGERWTFTRLAGAKTSTQGDVTASRCPACGAELRLSLEGNCSHCRASVTNGTVDWVVADVKPAPFVGYSGESQMAVAAPSVAAGIAALCAADPAFSADAFDARAKQAFLCLQDAWCTQDLNAGRAFLSPGAFFTWSAQLEALAAEGRRNVMENIEIRGVDLIRVVHGRVFDDLTVRMSAVAADFEVDASGKIVFGDRTVRPFSEYWTFQRCAGVATTGKPGTLENTCPSCGAPISLTQIGECRYCKAAVTSGKFDWVLSRIEQEDGESGGSGRNADDFGRELVSEVGGAIVGGLLGHLLSGSSSNDNSR